MYWRTAARQHEGRVKAKNEQLSTQEAFLRRVAEVVGVEYDQRPDPEELSERLEAANTAAKARAVELAVYMTAAQSGANAPALLDSREFMSRTAGLDADSQDFQAHVAELVREAAQQERYQVPKPPPPPPVADPAAQQIPAAPPAPQPPAAANGADFSGAPGGNRLWTQADYDHYMATAGTEDRDGSKLSKAIEDGLLVNLGVGRPKMRKYR
jgi:hypothetical protein